MEQHEFARCLLSFWIIPSAAVQGNNLSAGHLHSAWCWPCPWHFIPTGTGGPVILYNGNPFDFPWEREVTDSGSA